MRNLASVVAFVSVVAFGAPAAQALCPGHGGKTPKVFCPGGEKHPKAPPPQVCPGDGEKPKG
jgi:hypothetical protein